MDACNFGASSRVRKAKAPRGILLLCDLIFFSFAAEYNFSYMFAFLQTSHVLPIFSCVNVFQCQKLEFLSMEKRGACETFASLPVDNVR